MSLPTPEELSTWIAAAITCNELRVAGDGRHFEALIVSEAFTGLSKVRRHQLVYQALGNRMVADIHALSMRTLTPEEYTSQE
ncbi:MAG: BolA/IbaG family iron-sulfur metabolism protein [Proteobacteria bacterium]|nr:BolA/IbaG family iron-sulfur metabolism protein [Pseudomonadota bacterium]MCH9757645.1 BolA/IbaG family iron-sulfur metabolism protein [Pseudomonadota bacterium]